MSTMNLKLKKENAVSPVVGVMLMLVVTIIIAGIVAAFAGGLVGETTPASTVSIGLDNYDMGTLGYDGTWGSYTYKGFEWGYNESQGADNYNYAVYNMTFKHSGGNELETSDLTLAITFNGATYTTPFPTDVSTFSAGDIIELTASTDTAESFGLSQQNMDYGPSTFTWAIKDSSDYVIAKGTAKTLVP